MLKALPCILLACLSSTATARAHAGNSPSASSRNLKREKWEHRVVQLDEAKHEEEFWTFVTRPDLDAPRWNIKIHDEAAVAPGYWFVAPYEEVDQEHGSAAWNAPHIYDQGGQLIWSGAPMFDGFSVFDFRVSDIRGEPMLTLMRPHYSYAAVLDNTYTNVENVSIGLKDPELDEIGHNMHEFTTVENGTRALFMNRMPKHASKEFSAAVDWDGECHAQYDGFRELDTETWEPTFDWNSYGKIGLDESFVTKDPIEERCKGDVWDFLHFNSIDKFPDGDYLLSGRRSNALYKISGKDGHIVWRLGGKKSDFDLPFVFSGQHAAKIRAVNDKSTLISFLDNAFGPGDPETTNDASRGLLISVDEKAMTAEIVQEFKHPDGLYAEGQGNLQWVPGTDHAWICWREHAMHTEHAADGSLIMEAQFEAGVRNYRSFKLPWVGRPAAPPDVRSTAVQAKDGTITTIVSMSWNGATEVREWEVYESNPSGTETVLIATVKRTGFETTTQIHAYVDNILVRALDKTGEKLGQAEVFATVPTRAQLAAAGYGSSWSSVLYHPYVPFIMGILVSVSACIGAYGIITSRGKERGGLLRWRRKLQPYQSVSEMDKEDERAFELHQTDSEISLESAALLKEGDVNDTRPGAD